METESVTCPKCSWANDPRSPSCESCHHPLVQVGMVDPLGQIVRECEGGALPWKSVALTYAFAIRQDVAPGLDERWRAPNEAIVKRFGTAGREKIKALAWAYVEGRKSP